MAARNTATIHAALRWSAERLARAECESPRLDAEILLAETLRVNRPHLLAHANDSLPEDAWAQFRAWVARREKREPVAYIIGRREFYGLDFVVTPAVLIPRPETEHLVEEALALVRQLSLRGAERRSNLLMDERLLRCARNDNDSVSEGLYRGSFDPFRTWARNDSAGIAVADVGTGSGAIAVSLAVHLPGARVCAMDSSAEALAVAWRNAERHGVAERVCLLQSDLLENLPRPVDILAANLPYISDAEWDALAPEIRLHEPSLALRGGADGLDAIRRLLHQSPAHLRPGGAILLEIGSEQSAKVREIAQVVFPGAAVRIAQDYASLDRVVVIRPHETTGNCG
jgi:release factor glutamine methyltransferase